MPPEWLQAIEPIGTDLCHTPSPMGFLGQILGRPRNERAFLLIPVGYPAEDAEVPDVPDKTLQEILVRVQRLAGAQVAQPRDAG